MQNNGIASNILPITEAISFDFFKVYFDILAAEYASSKPIYFLFIIFGILIFITFLKYIIDKSKDYFKFSILFFLYISYILYYTLCKMHIYAMVHANVFSCFTARYCYFFIPVIIICSVIIIYELIAIFNNKVIKYITITLLILLFTIILFNSALSILNNWRKAQDDIMTKTYIDNRGYNDLTILLGYANPGFNYYLKGYNLKDVRSSIDFDNLTEDKVWLYRANWNGEELDSIVNKLTSLGYKNIHYHDLGINQLYYFYK